MRLWSLHPKFLDAPGLTAAWREGLLAKKVLEGKTEGYRNHPQLERFKAHESPIEAIHAYLYGLYAESCQRGYCFDETKIPAEIPAHTIHVTEGQLYYEWFHLLEKLKKRSPERYVNVKGLLPLPHPLFKVVPGEIEAWEKYKPVHR